MYSGRRFCQCPGPARHGVSQLETQGHGKFELQQGPGTRSLPDSDHLPLHSGVCRLPLTARRDQARCDTTQYQVGLLRDKGPTRARQMRHDQRS
eukprot:3939420-Rhodomonas_salina.2